MKILQFHLQLKVLYNEVAQHEKTNRLAVAIIWLLVEIYLDMLYPVGVSIFMVMALLFLSKYRAAGHISMFR